MPYVSISTNILQDARRIQGKAGRHLTQLGQMSKLRVNEGKLRPRPKITLRILKGFTRNFGLKTGSYSWTLPKRQMKQAGDSKQTVACCHGYGLGTIKDTQLAVDIRKFTFDCGLTPVHALGDFAVGSSLGHHTQQINLSIR